MQKHGEGACTKEVLIEASKIKIIALLGLSVFLEKRIFPLSKNSLLSRIWKD